jgi:hypothetical protein
MSIHDDQLIFAMHSPKMKIEAIERLARSLGLTIPPPDWKNRKRALVQAIERAFHMHNLEKAAMRRKSTPQ